MLTMIFKDYKLMKITYLHIKILRKCKDRDKGENSIRKIGIKLKKGTTVLYQFRSPLTVLSSTENSKIQGLFKVKE